MKSIKGTHGDDNLTGTSETDSIFGDLGNDTLIGGGGADEFVFNNIFYVLPLGDLRFVYSNDGFDIIKNFSSGELINIDPVDHDYKPYKHKKITLDHNNKDFSYDRNTGALYFQGTQFATLENKPDFIPSLDSDLVNTNNVDTGVKINYDAVSMIRLGATSTKEFSNRNTNALSIQETQFATLENKSNFIPSSDGLTS
jgi:uncharacterized beta-barrel protein YwiB (DUF1934 family)